MGHPFVAAPIALMLVGCVMGAAAERPTPAKVTQG